MLGSINQNYFYAEPDIVRERDDGTEKIIFDERTAYDILESNGNDSPIQMLDRKPVNFWFDTTRPYKRSGHIDFEDISGTVHVETTPHEEVPRCLDEGILYFNILPDYMDPTRVGRNPLI